MDTGNHQMIAVWLKWSIVKNTAAMLTALLLVTTGLKISTAVIDQSAQLIPTVNGGLYPVVTHREFSNIQHTPYGLSFDVRYLKARGCQILGVNWWSDGEIYIPKRVTKPTPQLDPDQTGWQDAGTWVLALDRLEGTTAYLLSLCPDDKLTQSPFYPSDIKGVKNG